MKILSSLLILIILTATAHGQGTFGIDSLGGTDAIVAKDTVALGTVTSDADGQVDSIDIFSINFGSTNNWMATFCHRDTLDNVFCSEEKSIANQTAYTRNRFIFSGTKPTISNGERYVVGLVSQGDATLQNALRGTSSNDSTFRYEYTYDSNCPGSVSLTFYTADQSLQMLIYWSEATSSGAQIF